MHKHLPAFQPDRQIRAIPYLQLVLLMGRCLVYRAFQPKVLDILGQDAIAAAALPAAGVSYIDLAAATRAFMPESTDLDTQRWER